MIKKVVAIVLVIVLVGGLLYLDTLKKYKDGVNGMTFQEINLGNIADGVYIGECNVHMISARVAVTMKDGQIQNIDLLEHKHDRGAAAEIIVKKIVEAQTVQVDSISGATNSSKVIKKAVENALTQ